MLRRSWQKEDEFLSLIRLDRERLESWRGEELPAADRGHVAIVVVPWQMTAVPFFSIELARMFRMAGWKVTAIFDGIDTVGNASFTPYTKGLKALLKSASSWLPFIEVQSATPLPEDFETAKPLARLNAIYRMRGEGKAAEFHEARPEAAELLAGHLRGVRNALASLKPERVVVPGGVYGSSGA